MARLVMKFGGVSVADGNRLRHVGDLVLHFSRRLYRKTAYKRTLYLSGR